MPLKTRHTSLPDDLCDKVMASPCSIDSSSLIDAFIDDYPFGCGCCLGMEIFQGQIQELCEDSIPSKRAEMEGAADNRVELSCNGIDKGPELVFNYCVKGLSLSRFSHGNQQLLLVLRFYRRNLQITRQAFENSKRPVLLQEIQKTLDFAVA